MMNTTTSTASVNNNSDDVPSSPKDNEDENNKVDVSIDEKDDGEKETEKPEQNGQEGIRDDESVSSFKVQSRKSRSYTRDNCQFQEKSFLEKDNSSFYSSRKDSAFLTGKDFSSEDDTVRITGYLEKRSKMLGWKKLYFVLDGQLLAYYKSKSEYDNLSACCGSINLGIASTVRPIQIRGCKGYPIQIVTRSQVYYLRSTDKQILEHWLIAIQEAASSPTKISFPVWTDPGSQFFRYSFATLSQWSLSNSTDDITESLSQLPQNFYLKGGPHPVHNKLHKCHSFASLQSPSMYNTMPLKNTTSTLTNSSKGVQMRNKTSSPKSGDGSVEQGKVRHSSSMLLLESSEQAAALKEELTRKLPIGAVRGENNVKPSLAVSKQQKSDLPFLKNPKNESPDDESHHYDEIVDFEAIYENYEPCGDESSSEGANRTRNNSSDCEQQNDTDIYESVETMEGELWNEKNETNPNTRPKSHHNRNSANRLSLGSSDRNSYENRGYEMSKSLPKSDSLRNLPPLPDSDQPSSQFHKKFSIESDTSSMNSYGDMSVQSEKSNKKWKNKPFGGFFHKMFNKGKKSKGTATAPLVITGPVDLRSLHHQSRNSPINRPTNLPISEIEAGHATIKKSPPTVCSKPVFRNDNVMDELKMKVNRISREGSELEKSGERSKKSSLEKTRSFKNPKGVPKPSDLLKKTETTKPISSSDDDHTKLKNSKPTLMTSPSEERDELVLEPVVHRRKGSQSDEFQQKLAKFNRLSERLSSSFVCALNPAPVAYPTIGPIGRSHSWKINKTNKLGKTYSHDDTSPPLPPKKKNVSSSNVKPNFYDYPRNNKPISEINTKDSENNSQFNSQEISSSKPLPADTSIATFIRSLNKKNSTPDVVFSHSKSSLRDSKEDTEVDEVFEEIKRPPPPIPPKTFILSSSPSDLVDTKIMSSIPVVSSSDSLLLNVQTNKNVNLSPSTSHKSTDFENLEILSELSDTNASITPPDSPTTKSESQQCAIASSSRLLGLSPNDEQQDSLNISYSITSDETNQFAIDSLSNTPDFLKDGIVNEPTTKNDKMIMISNSENKSDIFFNGHKVYADTPVYAEEQKDSLDTSSIISRPCTCDGEIYENLRFATVNTIMQEFETVEETEDEISEMYDDFPTEFLTAVNLAGGFSGQDTSSPSASSLTSSSPNSNSSDSYSSPQIDNNNLHQTIRHSGIDQLQEFLSLESNASICSNDFPSIEEDPSTNFTALPVFNKTPVRAGAVSRLGHSSAVDQLQRIVNNSIRTARTDL